MVSNNVWVRSISSPLEPTFNVCLFGAITKIEELVYMSEIDAMIYAQDQRLKL